jgi:hypothetical protein
MKNKLFIMILCYSIISCIKPNKEIFQEKSTYFIDLDSIKREGIFMTSDIFKKINVIILENNDYALISDISGIEIYGNNIFIMDTHLVNKLFVFDKTTGKYLRQIGSLGQGPGEYLSVSDFCIDTIQKKIYLLDPAKSKIHKYNIETGKHIADVDIPAGELGKFGIVYDYIALGSNGKLYLNTMYWYMDNWAQEENDNRIMEIDFETGKYRGYISGNKYNLGWNERSYTHWNFFVSKSKYPKYVEEYMNTVFAVEPDTVRPYLTVKYKDWMTKELLYSGDDIESHSVYDNAKNIACQIHNYIEWGDYIYFEYKQKKYFPVLYNQKTGQTHHYEDKLNDLLVTKKHVITTEFFYVNSKAAYDYIYPEKWNAYQRLMVSELFTPKLDKREELIKLFSGDEEYIIIFEYEFR